MATPKDQTEPVVTNPEPPKSDPAPVAPPVDSGATSKEDKENHDTEQVVVFKLAGEEYAAPILDVQEIITTGDITPFPNVPDYIAGIINVRGTVATIINLSKKFSLARKDETNVDRYIILTNIGKSLFGIMVDEVTSVMKIAKSNIKGSSGLSDTKIHTEYVQGVAVVDERVILILEFQKIIDEDSLSEIAEKAVKETAK